ncbi:glycosyltransferase [Azospirillum palustre]
MNRLVLCDQSLIGLGGHYYEYSTSVARAAQELGLSVLIAANRSVDPSLFQGAGSIGLDVLPWFAMSWGEAAQAHRQGTAVTRIADELSALLDHCGAAGGDIVLLHTLGWEEADDILHWLLGLPADAVAALPHIRLLFRFPLSWLYEPWRSSLVRAFARLQDDPPLCHKLGFLSDTEPLARSFTRLFGHPFTVMPIPFRTDLLDGDPVERRDAEAAAPAASRPAGPLAIGYFGDARLEKGYHLLPSLLSRLWRTAIRPGKARFLVQSHFNAPGGEPGMLQARNQLLQFTAPQVELTAAPLPTADYYRRLQACDAVLIPYDPDSYAERSSGILVEALVAGKPVIVPEGSWMAGQVSAEHAAVYRHPDGLFEAVQGMIDRHPDYAAAAGRLRSHWRERTDPRGYVRALLATVSANPVPVPAADPALRVALVMDGDAMLLRNGASRVAVNQIDHLARSGYRITGVFVSTRTFETGEAMERWRAALEACLSSLPVAEVFCLFHLSANLDGHTAGRLARMAAAGHYSLERDLLFAQGLSFPPDLLKTARKTRFDLVVLNYVRFLPVVEALGWDGVPLLCEMHDIQSFQKALYGNRDFDPREFDLEKAMLRRCGHVVSLSELEVIRLREDMGDRISHLPMPLFTDGAGYERILDAPDLGALVASCGIVATAPEKNRAVAGSTADAATGSMAEAATGSSADAAVSVADTVIDKAKALPGIDLLFVSSGHEPNCRGLIWFLETVYFPHLSRAGVTLFVAGSIAWARNWPDHPNIVFTGMLDDVAPLYAAAKLVILPIHEGAGGAIKMIEAVAAGKPIVSTSFALRGALQDGMDPDFVCDTPLDFASAVLALLESSERRRRCRDLWRRTYESAHSLALYDERLAAVIGRLCGRPPVVPSPQPPDSLPEVPVEWGPGIQALGGLLSDWAGGRPLDYDRFGVLGAAYGQDWPRHVRTLLASVKNVDRIPALRRFAGRGLPLIDLFTDLIDIGRPVSEMMTLSGPSVAIVYDDLGHRHYAFYAGTVFAAAQRLWRTAPHSIVVTCLSAPRLPRPAPGCLTVQVDGRELPASCIRIDEVAGTIRVALPVETDFPGAWLTRLSLAIHGTLIVTNIALVTEISLVPGQDGAAAVIGDNWHGPERERGQGVWRWTGPERSSWLRLPVFTDPRMRVALTVTDSAIDRDVVPELHLDGYALRPVAAPSPSPAMEQGEAVRELVYALDRQGRGRPLERALRFGSADLTVTLPATAPHARDGSRRCGVAVGSLRVVTDLLSALGGAA